MPFGNDEQMPLMHWINIEKSNEQFILINFTTGDLTCDNFAKKTIHKKPPLIYAIFYKFSKGNTTIKTPLNTHQIEPEFI